jgi:hypothetical protein
MLVNLALFGGTVREAARRGRVAVAGDGRSELGSGGPDAGPHPQDAATDDSWITACRAEAHTPVSQVVTCPEEAMTEPP